MDYYSARIQRRANANLYRIDALARVNIWDDIVLAVDAAYFDLLDDMTTKQGAPDTVTETTRGRAVMQYLDEHDTYSDPAERNRGWEDLPDWPDRFFNLMGPALYPDDLARK